MGLSSELISQFVKITNDSKQKPKEKTVYGTVRGSNGNFSVQLDGASLLTPVISTTGMKDGDRVTVMIKNHSAVVTGNLSSPSASSDALKDLSEDLGIVGDDLQGVVTDFDLLVKTVEEINDDLTETGQQVVGNRNEINAIKARPSIEAMTVLFSGYDIQVTAQGVVNFNKLHCDSSNGKLIKNGIGIAVGPGVKKVMVSFSIFLRNNANIYAYYFLQHCNSSGGIKNQYQYIADDVNAYCNLVGSDILVDVAQGDYFRLWKQEPDTINIIREQGTYLTVKVAL